jgi:hypothetical protein
VSLFGVCEFRCGILREVRREKALGFGKGEAEVRQRLHLQAQFAIAGAIEQMATLLAVFREEMEVVTGDAECAGKPRRPNADERAGDIREMKLALGLCSVDQSRARLGRIDGPRSDTGEVSVKPERVENIPRAANVVATG